jgi:protein-histidine pros-kinase
MSTKGDPAPAFQREIPFHIVAESARDLFAVLDEEGRFTYVNASYRTALGYVAEEMLTRHARDLIHPDDREQVGEGEMVEFRMRRADGSWIWLEGHTSIVPWQGQSHVVSIARDITERKQSEERLRQVIESSPSGIVMVDEDGQIVLVNAQVEAAFGYHRAELIGQPVEMLIPKRFRQEHPHYRAGFMADPKTRAMGAGRDLFGLRKDGSEFPIEIGLNPIRTDQGTMILSTVIDITERKHSEERLRQVIESSPSGIVMVDEDGQIVLVNAQVELAFGYDRSELIGQPVEMLIPERFRPQHPRYRAAFMAEPKTRAMGAGRDLYGLRKDGSEFPIEIGLNPITTDLGTMILSTIIDITERKHFEEQLIEAKEKAEEMTRLKMAFLANMSHEIRTPLTAIIGFSSILAKEIPKKSRDFAELIQQSGYRLMATLNSVLDLAQLEGKTVELFPETMDVRAVVAEVLSLFHHQTDMQGLYLRLDEPQGAAEIPALLDRAALDRILMNLVSNAIKFTHHGGITVTLSSDAQHVWMEVSDTGIGIGETFLQEIFKEFRQESTGLTRKYEGSGLGLAITKGLVQLLGGVISVESQLGQGSTFRVRLPRDLRTQRSRTEAPARRHTEPRRTRQKLRLLAVEDHEATRIFLQHLLEAHYEVDLVASLEQALRLTDQHQYDLVLLDINLGEGGDGVELLYELRANPDYQNIPIIACTAYAIPGDRDRFMKAGFTGYMPKPFTSDDLFEVIQRVITQG